MRACPFSHLYTKCNAKRQAMVNLSTTRVPGLLLSLLRIFGSPFLQNHKIFVKNCDISLKSKN
jgi:hypothetical protein